MTEKNCQTVDDPLERRISPDPVTREKDCTVPKKTHFDAQPLDGRGEMLFF